MTSVNTSRSVLPERPFRGPLGRDRVLQHRYDPSLDPDTWQVFTVFSYHYSTVPISFDGLELSRNSALGPVVVIEANH